LVSMFVFIKMFCL